MQVPLMIREANSIRSIRSFYRDCLDADAHMEEAEHSRVDGLIVLVIVQAHMHCVVENKTEY